MCFVLACFVLVISATKKSNPRRPLQQVQTERNLSFDDRRNLSFDDQPLMAGAGGGSYIPSPTNEEAAEPAGPKGQVWVVDWGEESSAPKRRPPKGLTARAEREKERFSAATTTDTIRARTHTARGAAKSKTRPSRSFHV